MVGRKTQSGFEKLEVYRLSESLADSVWRCVREWNILDRDTVGKQLIRAADSVGANIAEGYGRGSALDNRRFVRIAIGSLYETKHWLRRAFKRGLLNAMQIDELSPTLDRMLPMLNGYLKSIGRAKLPTHDLPPTTHDNEN